MDIDGEELAANDIKEIYGEACSETEVGGRGINDLTAAGKRLIVDEVGGRGSNDPAASDWKRDEVGVGGRAATTPPPA